MLTSKNFVLYLLLAVVPAVIINQFLVKTFRPRESFRNMIFYVVALLASAFIYTVLVIMLLLRFVWPLRQ